MALRTVHAGRTPVLKETNMMDIHCLSRETILTASVISSLRAVHLYETECSLIHMIQSNDTTRQMS